MKRFQKYCTFTFNGITVHKELWQKQREQSALFLIARSEIALFARYKFWMWVRWVFPLLLVLFLTIYIQLEIHSFLFCRWHERTRKKALWWSFAYFLKEIHLRINLSLSFDILVLIWPVFILLSCKVVVNLFYYSLVCFFNPSSTKMVIIFINKTLFWFSSVNMEPHAKPKEYEIPSKNCEILTKEQLCSACVFVTTNHNLSSFYIYVISIVYTVMTGYFNAGCWKALTVQKSVCSTLWWTHGDTYVTWNKYIFVWWNTWDIEKKYFSLLHPHPHHPPTSVVHGK